MTCPLCAADAPLQPIAVAGGPDGAAASVCATCADQISGDLEPNHWRGLASAMWSGDPAIQILSSRILTRLAEHDWARDLSDQLWLDGEMRAWAENVPMQTRHKDSNGAPLTQGDTVVLIKDLPVKGAGFTAHRRAALGGKALVADNPAHIEGRVEGLRIVILTEFVKKR